MSDKNGVSQSEIIPRLYMKLLPVQIFLVIIGGINAIIDNAFAGNLIGPQSMAVTGLFGPVTNLLNGVNVLIFGGAQVLCGRYLGKNMVERTRGIFTLDMMIMATVSGCLLFVCEIFPDSIAVLLGAKKELVPGLASYIRGFATGLPFFCMGTQFTAFLQLEHEEKRIYGSIFIMFVVNALSNLLFVAVFKLGLFGLGLATSLGNLFFFLIQAVYFLGKKAVIRFCRDSIVLSDIKEILINGFPRAITHFGISIRMILLNSMIQQYVGENGLAAYSAVYSFSCVQWSIPAGVTSAVMTLGSVYVGEEDKMGLKTLMKTFLTRGVPLVLLAAIVESALCLPATNLFFHDPLSAVYQMTLIGFMLFPLYTPFSTLMAGFSNYYHCLSHEGIVRTLSVADGIVAVCLFTFILIPIFGMNGVWAGQIVGSAFCVLIILIYATIYNKRPVFDLDGLMCFDKDFGVPDDQRIDITIRSMDEVINLSERILNFCNSFGVSGRRRYFSALCTEELAGNIVRHGFKDGKKHSIDIRVSYVNEEIVISFKDDGIPFNPEEAARLFGTEYKAESGVNIEDLHNIGLQLVSRISKSMTYQNTFGLNILTLVV